MDFQPVSQSVNYPPVTKAVPSIRISDNSPLIEISA